MSKTILSFIIHHFSFPIISHSIVTNNIQTIKNSASKYCTWSFKCKNLSIGEGAGGREGRRVFEGGGGRRVFEGGKGGKESVPGEPAKLTLIF